MLSRLLSAGNDDQHMHRRLSTQNFIRLEPININSPQRIIFESWTLATSLLTLWREGRTFDFRYIVFDVSTRLPLFQIRPPTSMSACHTFCISFAMPLILKIFWLWYLCPRLDEKERRWWRHSATHWTLPPPSLLGPPRPAQVATPLPPPPSPLSLNNLRTKNMTPTISSSNPLNILSRPLDHSHIFYVSLVWMQ